MYSIIIFKNLIIFKIFVGYINIINLELMFLFISSNPCLYLGGTKVLIVQRIPTILNNITKLNEHFAKFGAINNIQVRLNIDQTYLILHSFLPLGKTRDIVIMMYVWRLCPLCAFHCKQDNSTNSCM